MRLCICLLILSLVALLPAQGFVLAAAEPPTEPLLRLETGMHTAMITRIATDRDGRWLATASHDKTVRIWEVANGRLAQVLRPPIGEHEEGKLYAVAMSPDGEWVAASGWTSADGRSNNVYIFRRQAGTLVKAIPGHSNVITDLAWSPDGRFVAATLINGALHVYRAGTFDQVGTTPNHDCKRASYGADFDAAGRLVVSCYDGLVRLYQLEANGLRNLVQRALPDGKEPFSVRFAPAGHRIAVGFSDTTAVALLDGTTLRPLKSPDISGVTNGYLSSVAFSRDGHFLYAAGTWYPSERRIRRWSEAGDGPFIDLPGPSSTVMDLRPIRGGGVALGSQNPAWAVLDTDGRKTAGGTPAIADLRNQQEVLRLSRDGLRVAFGYEVFGESPAIFDLAARSLVAGAAATGLTPARTEGQPDSNWKGRREPKLDGKSVTLDEYEESSSLAIAPNNESVALGSLWYIRLFDRAGLERWKTSVPGAAWAVNVSGDGRFVVAALGDGTLRWYRMSDGRELLALFPHPDRQRWILWTPEGYYDAAVGAEDLLGWHFNQGSEREALFYPVGHFRERFYRPDVVSLVLETLDVHLALQQANDAQKSAARFTSGGPVTATGQPRVLQQDKGLRVALPPVVQLLEPAEGTIVSSSNVVVTYLLKSPTGEAVSEISVRIDGKVVLIRPDPLSSGEKEVVQDLTLPFPQRGATVSLVAKNVHGVSEPATARLHWGGQQESRRKANLNVLAIGVGAYPKDSHIKPLSFPGDDAKAIAALLKGQEGGGLYQHVTIHTLHDREATKGAIDGELEWLEKETGSDDVALLFLSGHGVKDAQGEYYFLPYNANLDRLKSTGIRGLILKDSLTTIGGKGKILFFFDTCYSGSLLDFKGAKGESASQVNVDELATELAHAPSGPIVFSSSTGRQLSKEQPEWKHGAFTKALLEGLTGQADQEPFDRAIDVKELDRYLYRRVKELTKGDQTPITATPQGVAPIPITLVR